jgi:hypothetical protein
MVNWIWIGGCDWRLAVVGPGGRWSRRYLDGEVKNPDELLFFMRTEKGDDEETTMCDVLVL